MTKSLNIISKALKIITLVLLMIYVLQSEVFAETFTPELQGAKTFGEDPFSIEYSVGNICINDLHWVYDGFEKVDVNWGFLSGPGILVKNTLKQSLGYIDHYNGAKYKNEYYDIREYIWLSNHTGSYGYIMIDDGLMAAMCDSSAIDAINNYMVREIHFYKSGTLNSQNPIEVLWKGIAQFRDCDGEEGVSINNLNAVYLSNNTWITKRDSNTWRGTADNANDDTNDAETTVWAEIYGLPDDPLVITYYGSIIHGATINFEGTTYTGKLTYNSNNYNKETTEQIISLGYDITVSENMFDTIEGLEFVGWNTKADGTGTNYTPNQVTQFKSATTLYAMWKVSDEFPNTPKVTIDMTFAQAGGGVECNHVWEVKADDTYHWEQCWKCGQIKENSKTKHDIYYLNGITQSTCNSLEQQAVQLCSGLDGKCTYEHVVPRPDHVSGPWVDTSYGHARACVNCGNDLDNQRCTNLSGQLLGCGTAGTCAVCGQYWNGTHGNLDVEVENYDGWGDKLDLNYKQMTTDIKCLICGQKFGTAEYGAVRFQDTTNKTRVKVKVTLNSGITANLNGLGIQTAASQLPNSTSALLTDEAKKLQSLRVNGVAPPTLDNQLNTFELQYDYEAYDTAQPNYLVLWLLKYPNSLGAWYINGVKQQGRICFGYFGMYPDTRAPEVLTSEFQVTNNAGQSGTVDGYSTKYNIKAVIFDEGITSKNTNNSVEVRAFNSKNELIKGWTKATKTANNRYTLSFEIIDEIRDEENIYIEARDQSGNISKKTPYLVRKIDNLDPQPVNKFETTQEWLRTKDFSYLFTDRGIGHIGISFNNPLYEYGDEQDIYRPGNTVDTIEYSRDYTLTGDVTGAAGVTIYAKDLLGNAASYRATVYNLDNTKPTINKCEVLYQMQNGKVINQLQIVDLNDFCLKIQQEGSGIAGYAIVEVNGDKNTVPSIPQTPDELKFVSLNTFNIVKSAWYFVYAIDGVQLISDPYPIYVECIEQLDGHELILTVDALAAEGKGGINLKCLFITSENAISKIWRANADSLSYTQIIEDPSEWVSVNVNSTSNISQDSLANDFSAPNPVSQVTYLNSESDANMVVLVTRPKDNGTWYTHIAQQFLVGHEAYQFSEDNDYVNMTNYTLLEVLTGVKGYYYFVDDKEDLTIVKEGSLIKSLTGEEYELSSGSNIVNKDVIYNKTLHIEYIRDIIGGLEQVIVDQDCATDEVINFNIDLNQIKEDYDFKVFRVYLHIAAYDNAGNLSETTTVPIKLTYITYKSNGSGEADVIQDMTIGESVELLGNIFDKDNSRLTGWNTKPDGTGNHYDSNKEYIFNDLITLYAEWDKISNLVIDPNGGSWTDSGAVTVKPNTDLSKVDLSPTGNTYDQPHSFKLGEDDTKQIKDPMKKGYNFEGWIIESVE